jgi:hypothetical protein
MAAGVTMGAVPQKAAIPAPIMTDGAGGLRQQAWHVIGREQ